MSRGRDHLADEQTVRARLPEGTVTLLFADIEGSTRIVRSVGDGYAALLERFRQVIVDAVRPEGGQVVDAEGDAAFIAFPTADGALRAAAEMQRALASEAWVDGVEVRARVGLHTGSPERRGNGYVGLDVHRAARIMGTGHGGQVVMSQATRDLAADHLGGGLVMLDLGDHRLRDLPGPERLWQLVIPGLSSRFPPLRTTHVARSRVPASLSSLIGRAEESDELQRLLTRPDVRLVTLTGPGGIGKSRLALAAAQSAETDFELVGFVPLAALRDPESVISAVAAAIDVEAGGSQPIDEAIAEAIGEKRVLLILDNFEQVAAAATKVAALAARSPGLTVLATSRVPLRVAGEWEFPVPPLETPEPDDSIEKVRETEAVKLFIDRAAGARPGFDVTADNGSTVAEIVRRLDGLPLAIELAAARTRMLPPAALLARLEERIDALGVGGPDLPERQRTLRATLDWSYELLGEAERIVLARLGVFAGSWTLDAAEAICADVEGEALELVGRLLEHSLVATVELDDDPEPRFRLLGPVREYARDRLEEVGGTDQAFQLVAGFYLNLTAGWSRRVLTAEQAAILDRLDPERDNLRALADWALQTAHHDTVVSLAYPLFIAYYLGDRLSEFLRLLEVVLRLESDLEPGPQAQLLFLRGFSAMMRGEYEMAEPALRRCLETFEALGDDDDRALALLILGSLLPIRGQPVEAKQLLGEAIELFDRLGQPWGAGYGSNTLGILTLAEGDRGRAEELLRRALAIGRANHFEVLNGHALTFLARVQLARRDLRGARRLIAQATYAYRKPARGLGTILENLAGIELVAGDPASAVVALAAAAEVRHRTGLQPLPVARGMVDALLESARRQLSAEQFREAWARGRALTPEQRLALCRGEPS